MLLNSSVVSLEFKGSDIDYFTSKVDGALKDNVLLVDFRTRTARSCNYQFGLLRASVGAAERP